MKTRSNLAFSILFLFSAATGACATATGGRLGGLKAERGMTTVAQGESPRALVQGPATVRAWSEVRGGEIFTAPALTGTDRDCANGSQVAIQSVPRDRRFIFSLGAGEVACLQTDRQSGVELLWRSQETRGTVPTVVAKF